ncbi:MAG: sigma-70 family RNA polymerase sigma factor [bacterium]|nr:sigma-70 family RNA polymerase sigma factor [bacterium]
MNIPLFSKTAKNQQRFKALAYPHITFLYNLALRYCGNTHDAEDMVQETMCTAFAKFHQLRDESKCKNWLFSILHRTYLKEINVRKQQHVFQSDEHGRYIDLLQKAAAGLNPAEAFEKHDAESRIRQLIDTLPEKYTSPLLLYYMEDMSYQEISEYLNVPVGTVMSRLSRAKKLLKTALLRTFTRNSAAENVVELNNVRQGR